MTQETLESIAFTCAVLIIVASAIALILVGYEQFKKEISASEAGRKEVPTDSQVPGSGQTSTIAPTATPASGEEVMPLAEKGDSCTN